MIVALAPPAAEPSQALRAATAEASERFALPTLASAPLIEVAPLDQLIRIRAGQQAAALATHLSAHAGTICPNVRTEGALVVLTCRTSRLDAMITQEGGRLFLDVQALRGLPWRPGLDAPPPIPYLGFLGESREPCPGERPAMRGECAFAAGRWVDAARAFRGALDGPDKSFAALRMGDLALIAAEPAMALVWYERARMLGPVGRMANSRLCELDAQCFEHNDGLETEARDLPDGLWRDMILRRARLQAFLGHPDRAVRVLADAIAERGASVCDNAAEATCHRVLLHALRTSDGKVALGALELMLGLPRWERGAGALEMVRAAAESAAKLGAPTFGANLLSTVTGDVPDADKAEHLLRTAELYVQGRDWARARVIVEFAQARQSQGKLGGFTGPRWTAVRQKVTHGETGPDEPSRAERGRQLEQALEAELAEVRAKLAAAKELNRKAAANVSAASAPAGVASGRVAGAEP